MKTYIEPKMYVIEFDPSDIIATSNEDGVPGSGEQPGLDEGDE